MSRTLNNYRLLIHDRIGFLLFCLGVILYFFQSIHVWFLWGTVIKSVSVLFCCVVCLYNMIVNKNCYSYLTYKKEILILMFSIVSFNGIDNLSYLSIIKSFIDIVIFYSVILLRNEVLSCLFDKFTKILAVISGISIVGWTIFLVSPSLLPHSYLTDNEFGYSFVNYYFFLYQPALIFPRFSSIFLEPGHYVLLSIPCLFVNKFNLRNKYVLTIFIATIFTFSVAATILCFYSLICFNHKKRDWYIYVIIISLISFSLQIIKDYNRGDNMVNYLILRRLEFDEDKGITGNNRNSEDFNKHYERFLKSDSFFWGEGNIYKQNWDGGNAGIKVYMVISGLVPTLFTLLIYWNLIPKSRNRRTKNFIYAFFILQMLLFAQACNPFWFSSYFLYLSGMSKIEEEKLKLS